MTAARPAERTRMAGAVLALAAAIGVWPPPAIGQAEPHAPEASLTPASAVAEDGNAPTGDHGPYALAWLTIANPTGRPISAVTLQPVGGGPTIRLPRALAPGQSARWLVPLPAMALNQRYRIGLLAGGQPLHETELTIQWRLDQLADEDFLAPSAYDMPEALEPASWSPAALQRLWLIAAAFAVAACGGLLIRRGRWRLLALAAVIGGASLAAMAWGRPQPQDTRRLFADWDDPDIRYLALAAGRTATGSIPEGSYYPVYYSMQGFLADRAVIEPGGQIHVPLRPDWVRVFRVRTPGRAND